MVSVVILSLLGAAIAIGGVWEHMPEDSDEKPKRRLGEVPAADILSGGRSIFDDVDA